MQSNVELDVCLKYAFDGQSRTRQPWSELHNEPAERLGANSGSPAQGDYGMERLKNIRAVEVSADRNFPKPMVTQTLVV